VLDDVQRRRFLVQPAREDAPVAALRIARLLDVELHECAGQPLRLPRRRGFAGTQPHDRVADPRRLAGLELQLLGDAVALVEEAEHRHALRHGGRSRRLGADRLRDVDGARLAIAAARARSAAALPAGGKRKHGREGEEARPDRRPHP
jgi:hypothetical protein